MTALTQNQPVIFARLPVLFDELGLYALPEKTQAHIKHIDALLPQTQCGLCGYADGCLPYAHAIITKNEATNLCVPGGDITSRNIAEFLGTPALPAAPSKWDIDPTTARPKEVRAVIDESACIGCTKCLPACPVDAIIGTAKHMHSVITPLCTGCELCLAPCPVDCIHLEIVDTAPPSDTHRKNIQEDLRRRYHAHLDRLAVRLEAGDTTPVTSHQQSKLSNSLASDQSPNIDKSTAETTVAAARLRTQIKKLTLQQSVRFDPKKAETLAKLEQELAALNA
ncbi:MAG: RnfABCDGE type electron transport complex subunit B [Moraxella sp.]|nr:RnfABCDGE type electron transport complex subunit B [Moraxella sp.]